MVQTPNQGSSMLLNCDHSPPNKMIVKSNHESTLHMDMLRESKRRAKSRYRLNFKMLISLSKANIELKEYKTKKKKDIATTTQMEKYKLRYGT